MDILLHNVGVPLWAVCLAGLILAVLAVLRYAVNLCEQTRVHPLVEMGVSPRGIAALASMAQANAVLRERNYVIPEDVQWVFADVCAHRVTLRPQARVDGMSVRDVLSEIMDTVKPQTGSLHS